MMAPGDSGASESSGPSRLPHFQEYPRFIKGLGERMTAATRSARAFRSVCQLSRHEIRRVIACHEAYLMALKHVGKHLGAVVNSNTEVVIEGFPRTGNSFAVSAFELAQDRPVAIAHHSHAPAQVRAAARLGIPTMVLVRAPGDAIVSALIRSPTRRVGQSLREYCTFYGQLEECMGSFIVVPFTRLISNFGAEIHRLNAAFGTDFLPFEHGKGAVAEAFQAVERTHRVHTNGMIVESKVARPSVERALLKAQVADLYRSETEGNRRLGRLKSRAEAMFNNYEECSH